MRKLISTLAVCLITLSQTLSASWFDVEDTSFDVGLGYRQDTLEFRSKIGFDDSSSSGSFVSGGTNNEIHEHDKFKDINLWQISAAGRASFCDGIYVRAWGDYAQVVDGRLHTRYDFLSASAVNTSQNQMSITAKADRGYAYDFEIGLGYEFSFCCDQFKIAPVVGYSYDVQRFKSKSFHLGDSSGDFSNSSSDSIIVVDDSSSFDSSSSEFFFSSSSSGGGASSGVRNTTRTQWNGGWVGFDALYNIDCDWNIFGSFEYHFARMNVKFHTRVNDFVDDSSTITTNSYHANAYGPWFRLGTAYRFDECWSVGVDGAYYYMRSDSGKRNHNTGVRLDRVTWQSFNIEGFVAYHF